MGTEQYASTSRDLRPNQRLPSLILEVNNGGFSHRTCKVPAGKDRTSDASQLKDAMNGLQSNILTLKRGGMISGVDLKPLAFD